MPLFEEGPLGQPTVLPESPGQRLVWERRILEHPVSAPREPTKLVANRLPEHVPSRRYSTNARLTIAHFAV